MNYDKIGKMVAYCSMIIIPDTWEDAKQFNLCWFTENAEGKYISPFHDIPMFADESQVKYNSPH